MEFTRDYAMYAAIFGTFAISWFGWAQENPPKKWRVWLGIASALSFGIAAIGVYLAIQHWQGASALRVPGASATFGIVVGVECVVALLGALLLQWRKRSAYVSLWIAIVVGVHFVPLAQLFKDEWLYLLAALLVFVPGLAVFLYRKMSLFPGAITCMLAGVILLFFAIRGLLLAVFR